MVIAAFKNLEKVVSFDDEASLTNTSAHFFNNAPHANSASTSQVIGGLDYPQVANSLTSEPESITRTFSEDVGMQYICGAEGSFQSWSPCSESDLQSVVDGFLLDRAVAFAQRRWTMLFSVLKWFSIWRILPKKTHVKRKRKCC